jgi:hypothetical protein
MRGHNGSMEESRKHSSAQLQLEISDILIARLLKIRITPCRLLSTSLTLVNFQFDTQNSYLFIYNIFIKILYMFRALPYSSSGGLRRNCIYAASGIVTFCR